MATDLIRLSGLQVGRDIAITYTGLRPGEKLFEELFLPEEEYARTRHEKIFIASNANRLAPGRLDEPLAALERAADLNDRDAIIRTLQNLIPEYCPPEAEQARVNGRAPYKPNPTIHPAPGSA
jgi:FlaA1/EpsC-like NDP-sugar epimerase